MGARGLRDSVRTCQLPMLSEQTLRAYNGNDDMEPHGLYAVTVR
jgi:hypothetical protein